MSAITSKELAIACLKAQKMQEASYNEKLGGYSKTHHQCAREVCGKGNDQDAYIIWLLNFCAWNDVQAWAKEYFKLTWDSEEVNG